MDYEALMHLAIQEAQKSGIDVPVGAVIVSGVGQILALGHNQKEANSDASSHAEIEAIRAAGEKLGNWRLEDCTLVVTLEPCVMCAGAIVAARIQRVVFGAWDVKLGAAGSLYDILRDARLGSPLEVIGGVLDSEASIILSDFGRNKLRSGQALNGGPSSPTGPKNP
jgi:tRNA(adenine34) deaminase